MKYYFLFIISCLFSSLYINSQTTINGSFVHSGLTRTYSFYVPASYTPGQAAPLVLNLHGYTSNGNQQSLYTNFQAIADTAGFIIAHPDGTIEATTSQRFWNFGILGANVDDIGFLEALIDTLSAHYTINPNRIYSVGMSNGGFMSYCLACETDRFAAVGSVTGSMSVVMYNSCTPSRPTPTIRIHGTSDNVVPYAGNSTSKGAEEVTLFWANQNNCNTTPAITQVPNTSTSDGATAEHYVYSGGTNGNTVELYKVTGGGHTWPDATVSLPSNGNTCRDFNATKEIWRFFSQYERGGTLSTGKNMEADQNIAVYPNPAQKTFVIKTNETINADIYLLDLQGRLIKSLKNVSTNTALDLEDLKPGNYILKISNSDLNFTKKLTVTE